MSIWDLKFAMCPYVSESVSEFSVHRVAHATKNHAKMNQPFVSGLVWISLILGNFGENVAQKAGLGN